MLIDQLHQKRDQITAAGRQYGAAHPGIRIGRTVGRTHRQRYRFSGGVAHGYNMLTQRIPLQRRIAEITGRKTELVPEHELNTHIRANVLQEAIEL